MHGAIFLKSARGAVATATAFLLGLSVTNCTKPAAGEHGEDLPDVSGILSELKSAEIFDMVFSEGGKALDGSVSDIPVNSYVGTAAMTYKSAVTGQFAAHFGNEPGVDVKSGYFSADYKAARNFKAALESGFTLETLFSTGSEEKDFAVFSSVSNGGSGFSVSSACGGEIVFSVSAGGSTYTLRSGIVPEKGAYYHLLGSWNKDTGLAMFYVNGELKAQLGLDGVYSHPESLKDQWFGVGAKPDGGKASSAFRGEVLFARIYSVAVSEVEVSALWSLWNKDYSGLTLSASDILLFPEMEFSDGSVFPVLGEGIHSGDKIGFYSAENEAEEKVFDLKVTGRRASAEIGSSLTPGYYWIFLHRGELEIPVGRTFLIASDNPAEIAAPEIVAHRGYHTLPGVAENSVAALKASQDLGIYGCEIDVWITTDGQLVIHHDGQIAGKVFQNCSYDEIRNLTLSNGEKLPLLSDMLEQAKKGDTKLIIEIKEHSTADRNNAVADAVVDMVSSKSAEALVEYICFDYDVCKRIAAARPDATVGYLMGDKSPSDVLADGIRSIDYPFNTLRLDRNIVKDAASRDMIVNVWTVNTDEELMIAIAMGVDYITTDNPDRLKEICGMLADTL